MPGSTILTPSAEPGEYRPAVPQNPRGDLGLGSRSPCPVVLVGGSRGLPSGGVTIGPSWAASSAVARWQRQWPDFRFVARAGQAAQRDHVHMGQRWSLADGLEHRLAIVARQMQIENDDARLRPSDA